MLNHQLLQIGTKRLAARKEVNGFKQTGFTAAILSQNDINIITGRERHRLNITKCIKAKVS